jgi:hypothetical protein
MATTKFKLALNAANYPMTYRQASRSVLDRGPDVQFPGNSNFFGSADSVDYNTIQITFCENVIPIPKGLQSVGFLEEYPPYSIPVTDFDQLMLVRSSVGSNVSFSPARGKNYVYSDANAGWISYDAFVLDPLYKNVTYGYVNGRTLIFYESTKLVEWNPVGPSVDTLTLTLPAGFDISDIKGNSAASNYHLLYTDIDILWSTITDVLDFADTDLGAGRQIPIDLRGRITSVRPIAGGFMIYTSENVIAASFTNDASRPFAFREVQNSGGVNSGEQVTGEANAAGHYTYGTAGIQLVTLQRAETVFPEAADFLISGELDVWNPSTKAVDTDTLSQAMVPKMQYLGNRYLFISYGPGNRPGPDMYTHALVFDTTLQRWGKLKIDHTDINLLPLDSLGGPLRYYQLKYEYDYYDMQYAQLVYPADPPPGFRQNYGFLQNDGTVLLMITDMEALLGGGVVLFGRCQLRRSRLMTLQKTEIEGLQLTPTPVITALGSSTGAERTSVTTLVPSQQTDAFTETKSRLTSMNFDLAVEGGFQLTTFIVEATNHGTR